MHHDGIRMETRRTFIEGEGYLVEEVPVGAPLGQNQAVLAAQPAEPARSVVVTLDDVPLDLARKVVEANGLVVVPPSYLNETQLEELQIAAEPVPDESGEEQQTPGRKLPIDQAIAVVMQAPTFDELNRLTATENRAKVLAAAEARAAELKEQGKQ